jgi:hypothetical protein
MISLPARAAVSRAYSRLGAAWRLHNAAKVSNEAPKARFKIDALIGDDPFPVGRVVLDWDVYA